MSSTYLAVVKKEPKDQPLKITFVAANDASAIDEMRKYSNVKDTTQIAEYQLMRVVDMTKYVVVAEKLIATGTKQLALPSPEKTEVKVLEKSYTPYKKSMAA